MIESERSLDQPDLEAFAAVAERVSHDEIITGLMCSVGLRDIPAATGEVIEALPEILQTAINERYEPSNDTLGHSRAVSAMLDDELISSGLARWTPAQEIELTEKGEDWLSAALVDRYNSHERFEQLFYIVESISRQENGS